MQTRVIGDRHKGGRGEYLQVNCNFSVLVYQRPKEINEEASKGYTAVAISLGPPKSLSCPPVLRRENLKVLLDEETD